MTLRARPTLAEWSTVVAVWAAVAGLVLAATHFGDGQQGIAPTLAVPLGPLAGGFVRDWQSCCATNSWSLLPWALAIWAPGMLAAFLLQPTTRARLVLRWILWGLGWFAWFFAAILSYLHALE